MLDLWRLEILCRFAALGTITATARDLKCSASAISQQLATLEREVRTSLLERTPQRATLTAAGRELAEYAGPILNAVEELQSRMRARAGTISGQVAVSCIPALAPALAPHLAALQSEHSELAVIVHETGSTTAAAALLDRRYDLAVIDDWSTHPPAEDAGLAVHRLRREHIVLAIAADHPLAGQSGPATAAQIRGIVHSQSWLCAPVGQLSRAAGDQRLAAINATPRRRWEFAGLRTQAALVATGVGAAFLPDAIAQDHTGVVGLRLAPGMQRTILALTRTTAQKDPAVTACLHAVRQALSSQD